MASAVDAVARKKGGAPISILALSGGGAMGAYGAGFLNGWSHNAERPRPNFDVVTGVSTGALIAPFAFMGEEYDEILKRAYSTTRAQDVYVDRPLFLIPFASSLKDNAPLRNSLTAYYPDSFIDAIGRETERKLLVGATNLDRGYFRMFDLTAIARCPRPDRYQRFRACLLASASIPLVFPPTYIDDEMYVDGAAREWLFVAGICEASARGGRSAAEQPTHLYLIVNRQIMIVPTCVQPNLIGIGSGAIENLLQANLFGNLASIFLLAAQNQYLVNFTTVPIEGWERGEQDYDPRAMLELFELGYAAGSSSPDPWQHDLAELKQKVTAAKR